MVRHREVLWHVYYTAKFWRLIWGRQRETERERYAHDDRWRELDAVLGEPLERVPLAIVRRRGTVRSGEPAGSPSLGADQRDDLGRSAGPSGSATTTTTPSPA
jgi:hypothetical protein